MLHRYHRECVELFESLPDEAKLDPNSWAFVHITMSYVKDGMGILRWPKSEKLMKRRIQDIYVQCALVYMCPNSMPECCCEISESLKGCLCTDAAHRRGTVWLLLGYTETQAHIFASIAQ